MKVTVRLPDFIKYLNEITKSPRVIERYELEFRAGRSHGRYTEYIPEPDTQRKWIMHFIKWCVDKLDGRLD